jgi:hypothetical protein
LLMALLKPLTYCLVVTSATKPEVIVATAAMCRPFAASAT